MICGRNKDEAYQEQFCSREPLTGAPTASRIASFDVWSVSVRKVSKGSAQRDWNSSSIEAFSPSFVVFAIVKRDIVGRTKEQTGS